MIREELHHFIRSDLFPCIMAKTVFKNGYIQIQTTPHLESHSSIKVALESLYQFVDKYREVPNKKSSFVLVCNDTRYRGFDCFEKAFWSFLTELHKADKKYFPYDPRVSSDPENPNFSFSIKSEAFFILTLHPDSPRFSRRFKFPAIVFNPHQQFERMRENGIFKRVQDIIRKKDKFLQGFINPMLNDFGEGSEVYQYSGKQYPPGSLNPLHI